MKITNTAADFDGCPAAKRVKLIDYERRFNDDLYVSRFLEANRRFEAEFTGIPTMPGVPSAQRGLTGDS
jgi:hypothetical protein